MSKITIGAHPECDLVLNIPQVSGRHCVIEMIDDQYHLQDLTSTNGTFVNQQKIESCIVVLSDLISLGSYQTDLKQLLEMYETQKSHQASLSPTPTLIPNTHSLPTSIPQIKEVMVGNHMTILGRRETQFRTDGLPLYVQVEGGLNKSVSCLLYTSPSPRD